MIEGEELKGWSGEGRKNAAIVADLCRAATAKELSNTDPKFPRLGTAEITRNCSFELKSPPPLPHRSIFFARMQTWTIFSRPETHTKWYCVYSNETRRWKRRKRIAWKSACKHRNIGGCDSIQLDGSCKD